MAVNAVSRPGMDNVTNDATELLFFGFSGEVIAAYESNIKIMDKIMVMTLPKGQKTLSYPIVNTGQVKYHAPGADVLEDSGYATQPGQGMRPIFADRKITSAEFVDEQDEYLSNYDLRRVYADRLGKTVAAFLDKQVLRAIWVGADPSATATYTGAAVGYQVTGATLATQANALSNAIIDLKTRFDVNGVPDDDRYLILHPTYHNLLLKQDSNNAYIPLNQFYKADGNVAKGVIGTMFGFNVMMHNGLGQSNNTDTSNKLDSGEGNSYSADMSNAIGVAFHKDAVVAAVSLPLTVDQTYIPEKLGTAIVAKAAVGFGVVRPESCGRLKA